MLRNFFLIQLMSFAGRSGDVPDPFGGSIDDYADCLEMMKEPLAALAHRLGST